jgi:hypothetical protein
MEQTGRYPAFTPETATSRKTRLGVRHELYVHGSFAASISLAQNLRRLSAMFISAMERLPAGIRRLVGFPVVGSR